MSSGELGTPVGPTDLHTAAARFQPVRLTLARERMGLTKTSLAVKIHKTPAALSQFESGQVRPDARTVGVLAFALGVPPSFFTVAHHAPLPSIDNCHFRSLRSASQRDRRRLLATACLRSQIIEALGQHVDFPPERISEVAATASDAAEIEQCAVATRKGWGLGMGPIPNLTTLLESRGVVVSEIPTECRKVDAFSTWHARRPLVFLVMYKGSASRTRFDAAHELGHLVMHDDVTPGSPSLERQANRFAGAFLIPRESFLAECPRRIHWDHLYEMKRRWRVSVAGLVRRGYDLGVYSESAYRRAYMHLNATGERTSEKHEPPEEPPTLLRQALTIVREDGVLTRIAEQLGLSQSTIADLVDPRAALRTKTS
ncbi:MAG: XRE family transcriptional regulator [Sandaracinaceae bacterium]